MIIVRRMDNGCGIFVKIVTNLWREEISTYQQITTKRGCSKRASSFYLLSKFVFDPILTFYKASCHYRTSVICCYV
ncbi:hypothetical protein EWV32_30220 [Bacillus thuringiensis]|nr:hypothetical protein EWV32_30220 [Bacillus thuringiensis]